MAVRGYLVDARPIPAPIGDFSVLAGRRVLDVGCGNGVFLKQADEAGAAVIGGDLSTGMLAAASEAVPTAPLLCLDADRLPLPDDSVDVALALWMLYHVDDRPAAAAELRRVVRPDGYAVVSTNSGENPLLDDLVGPGLTGGGHAGRERTVRRPAVADRRRATGGGTDRRTRPRRASTGRSRVCLSVTWTEPRCPDRC